MPTFINGRALAMLFGFALAIAPEAASAVDRSVIAQTSPRPQSSPEASPEASAAPSATGPDLNKLTPAQQAALQAAIIKTSQNPVGNIAIIPFQNNFNYGVGPYTRFQYNLNMQPVVPFMLSKKYDADCAHHHSPHRSTIVRAAGRLRVAIRLRIDIRPRRRSGAIVLCSKNKTGCVDMGRRAYFSGAERFARHVGSW
jgi:hypothetical protein